jgi:hypothetical protein
LLDSDTFANNGKKTNISERISQKELGGSDEIPDGIPKAAVYIRGRIEAAKNQPQEQFQNEAEGLEKQAAFDYAKEQNIWIDNLYSLGKPLTGGGNENTFHISLKNSSLNLCHCHLRWKVEIN